MNPLHSPLQALLVDDNKMACDHLQHLLESNCPEVAITATCGSASEAKAYLTENPVDVVFLDIKLHGSTGSATGFSLLKELPRRNFLVIFVTAYEQYALPAIQEEAVDYLLKPLDTEALRLAVEKAIRRKGGNGPLPTEEPGTPPPPHPAPTATQRIPLPTTNGFMVAKTSGINHLEAVRSYVTVVMRQGKQLVVCKPLKHFESQLDPTMFMRIHNKYIVHRDAIVEYTNTDGGLVVMENGKQLPIARRRVNAFIKWYRGY